MIYSTLDIEWPRLLWLSRELAVSDTVQFSARNIIHGPRLLVEANDRHKKMRCEHQETENVALKLRPHEWLSNKSIREW